MWTEGLLIGGLRAASRVWASWKIPKRAKGLALSLEWLRLWLWFANGGDLVSTGGWKSRGAGPGAPGRVSKVQSD